MHLQDEVVSIALLILVEYYIKLKQQKHTDSQIDQVNQRSADSERKDLLNLFQSELAGAHSFRENTYYTLMFIAFDKKSVTDLPFSAIPKIDETFNKIKTVKLRQDYDSKMIASSTSSFDIDLFFIVLEQFRKYNIMTKRIFLNHIHTFLKNHQKAFMMVFEENQSTENLFKKKLLSFFFMIITECISSADNGISLLANNILIEVLYFQLM